MKKIFSPRAIMFFIVLPQLVAMGYITYAIGFSQLKTILLPSVVLLFSCMYFAAYAYSNRNEKSINSKMFIAISVLYTIFILVAGIHSLPYSSARIIVSPKLVFILLSMLPVLYGIIGFCNNTTPLAKTYEKSKYQAGLIIVPLVWFLAGNLLSGMNSNALLITLMVVCSYVMIFLIAKVLFIWRFDKESLTIEGNYSKKYYATVIFTALIMPLFGLYLNQSFTGITNNSPSSGMFGDFSHPLFYIIAVVNAALLLVPKMKNVKLRLLIFYLKSVGYAYILYFCIIFIPLIPLGLYGIILFGLGLLILSPAMVTLVQGYHLFKEWAVLKKSFNKWQLLSIFVIGILTIPLCMGITVLGDKSNFQAAIHYLQPKDSNAVSYVNLNRLERTLKNVSGNLRVPQRDRGFSEETIPILSGLYTNFVLDGKIVSQENVSRLENLFFDAGHNKAEEDLSDSTIVNSTSVHILEADSKTSFDAKIGVYKSWVNLKLGNYSRSSNCEYVTTFKLPDGAYISDYYLDVLGTKKPGILTDRRAALFIYRKIVNTKRDPGLLHYVGKNTVELRVFPFSSNEIRETGFEIIHSEKLTLNLDDKVLSLVGDDTQKEINVKGAVLLPAEQKTNLKPVLRKSKYYFVIDSSEDSDVHWHMSQIKEYTKANNITDAEVIFSSHKLRKYTLSDMPQAKYKTECGFNLNLAVNDILNRKDKDSYPIIVAVSDNLPSAVLPYSIYSLSKRFPESPYYYALNHNLSLTAYTFESNEAKGSVDNPIVEPILDYNGVYVTDNNKTELVSTGAYNDTFKSTNNQYKDAVLINGMLLSGNGESLDLLRASFRAKVLTPQTAFIVVETSEQEAELLSVQESLLKGNAAAPTVTLDEPSFMSCIILILFMALIIGRKKIKSIILGGSLPNYKGRFAEKT